MSLHLAPKQSLRRGHSYEFVHKVPEDYYCKKCSLVARKLAVTSCCGEHYCHDCIAAVHQEGEQCPVCGEQSFSFFIVRKHSQQISDLRVYCNNKEHGCDWSGSMKDLKVHLKNCHYLSAKCPLCQLSVIKVHMEWHMKNECAMRDYSCQYCCSFKGTYREVVDKHYAECQCMPVECPNLCGVTCNQRAMKSHLKICSLQKEECSFSLLGCRERVTKEEAEKHLELSLQHHLHLTAATVIAKTSELEEKIRHLTEKFRQQEDRMKKDYEKMCKGNEEELKYTIWALREKIQKQETKFQQEMSECNHKLAQVESASRKQAELIDILQNRQKEMVSEIQQTFSRNFLLKIPHKDKWTSPFMYTHMQGYKFNLSFWKNSRGEVLWLMSMEKGKYDSRLTWPVVIRCTVEVNDHERQKKWTASYPFSFTKDFTENSLLGTVLCKVSDLGHIGEKKFHLAVSIAVL